MCLEQKQQEYKPRFKNTNPEIKKEKRKKRDNQIQNSHSSQPRVLELALTLLERQPNLQNPKATHHIKQPVTPFRDKSLNVERQPSLQNPKALQAESRPESHIGNKEPGLAGKD